jgi:hypothetical protein
MVRSADVGLVSGITINRGTISEITVNVDAAEASEWRSRVGGNGLEPHLIGAELGGNGTQSTPQARTHHPVAHGRRV